MTYFQFIQAVESKMKEEVKEDITVSIYTAGKNNGVKRHGISIAQKGINISPTIYLEEYYEQFLNGLTIENIVSDIQKLYQDVRLKKSWDAEKISVFDMIKENIVYRLVNFESNKELLEEVPYVPYLDLAIIFYVMLDFGEWGTAGMLIRNEHMEMWKVTEENIYEKAKENTWRLLPVEFHTMKEVMEELQPSMTYVGENILYVLTNQMRSFGAAVILYEGCLEMIANYLGDNYYVLPSSVHEVIIVMEKKAPYDGVGLSEMVQDINRTQVEEEDVLSDYAYYYDREKKKLL